MLRCLQGLWRVSSLVRKLGGARAVICGTSVCLSAVAGAGEVCSATPSIK